MQTQKEKDYERTPERKATKSEWTKRNRKSLTGFRLKKTIYVLPWEERNVVQCLKPTDFLQLDVETRFYRCLELPGLLFPIPFNLLTPMRKLNISVEKYNSLVASGAIIVKTPRNQ